MAGQAEDVIGGHEWGVIALACTACIRIGWAMRRCSVVMETADALGSFWLERLAPSLQALFIALLCCFGLSATLFHHLKPCASSIFAHLSSLKDPDSSGGIRRSCMRHPGHRRHIVAIQRLSNFTVDISGSDVG